MNIGKATATVAALGLMWLGYIAWPPYDLHVLVNALEKRDVETVVRHVYFDSVRRSLADQILTAYVQRTGVQLSPRLQGVAATALVIAEPVLSKVISPEALSEFLSTGWPVRVVPEVPPGTVGISSKDLSNAWRVFAASEYGFARYSIALPQSVAPAHRFTLTFKLLRWQWELTSITLPESIQNLLADELVKGDDSAAPGAMNSIRCATAPRGSGRSIPCMDVGRARRRGVRSHSDTRLVYRAADSGWWTRTSAAAPHSAAAARIPGIMPDGGRKEIASGEFD